MTYVIRIWSSRRERWAAIFKWHYNIDMAEYLLLGGLFYAAYAALRETTGKKCAPGCRCPMCAGPVVERYVNHRAQYADNEVLYNKVDWDNNDKPVQGKIYLDDPNTDIYQTLPGTNIEIVDANGTPVPRATVDGQVNQGRFGMSLTGEPINPENFVHNNMMPFFGAKVRQNMDEYANEHKLDIYTGTDKYGQEKREINPMFEPQRNLSNPYGAGNIYGYMKNRYIPSTKRTNEAPIPQIRVGPGLNKGYTSEPSGGFQQADTRDYAMPLSTNERRVLNKPKVSYMGRVVGGGSAISQRTSESEVRPVEKDLTRETAPGDYGVRSAQIPSAPPDALVGRGTLVARGQERDQDARITESGRVALMGPAASTGEHLGTTTRDQLVRESGRAQAVTAPLGAVGAKVGQWSIA